MTFQEFMEKYNLKNSATVKGWIDKGYIPGASFENNFIPDEAKPPYTKSHPKKPGSYIHKHSQSFDKWIPSDTSML